MRYELKRLLLFITIIGIGVLAANPLTGLAHGGEDHGDQKPKSTANAKGIVTHSSRLGSIEVMLKHSDLEPDQSAEGRLFITQFDTNAPFTGAQATVELESDNGSVFKVIVEASDQKGTYNLSFPAMPLGNYKMRANVSHGGETDTATFAGVEVKQVIPPSDGESSWVTRTMIGIIFAIVIGLLGTLLFIVWRFAGEPTIREETLSAS